MSYPLASSIIAFDSFFQMQLKLRFHIHVFIRVMRLKTVFNGLTNIHQLTDLEINKTKIFMCYLGNMHEHLVSLGGCFYHLLPISKFC